MYQIADVEVEPGCPWRCYSPAELALHEGDLCIVEQERHLEFGRIGKLATITGEIPTVKKAPTVLRRATLQDQSKANENKLMSKMARESCEKAASKHEIKMRLVRVRYSFDRDVLHVLFTCDDKTDTHEVVKDLAAELRTRVEMKQIGVRDEAGIIGGIGPCGRTLCCKWLRRFASINVRMAKTQGLSLNPSAIGGNCGRLKCCLNYEFEHYKELGRGLPRQGAQVECPDGMGIVLEANILAQRIRVRVDDKGVHEYSANDVKEVLGKRDRRRKPKDEGSGVERAES